MYVRADHEIAAYAAVHGYTPHCPGSQAILLGFNPGMTPSSAGNVVEFITKAVELKARVDAAEAKRGT